MFRLQGMQSQSQRGPIARLLTTLLLIAVGVIALFFGAVIVAILIGVAAILFIVLYLRAWWLRRKLGLNLHPPHHSHMHDEGTTIDGEYTVENSDKNKPDVR
ncbi:MAG: hypothetical protein ACRETA_06485 [Gammaproteobacteria bacterium]